MNPPIALAAGPTYEYTFLTASITAPNPSAAAAPNSDRIVPIPLKTLVRDCIPLPRPFDDPKALSKAVIMLPTLAANASTPLPVPCGIIPSKADAIILTTLIPMSIAENRPLKIARTLDAVLLDMIIPLVKFWNDLAAFSKDLPVAGGKTSRNAWRTVCNTFPTAVNAFSIPLMTTVRPPSLTKSPSSLLRSAADLLIMLEIEVCMAVNSLGASL